MSGGSDAASGKGFISVARHILRPKISAKIFIYFLCIAVIPLMVMSYILVSAANGELLKNAGEKQQAVAADLSRRVDNYLANNVNELALIARLYSTGNFSPEQINPSIATLFNQRENLQRVTLMIANGNTGSQRTISQINGKLRVTEADLEVGSEILKFLDNKAYLISVGRDENNDPQIGIGIPILKKYGSPTADLFASPAAPASNMAGAIVGYYDISDLWKSVLSAKLGKGGYAYVVDNVGSLVAHPDRQFLDSHREVKDVEVVKQFLADNMETKQTASETNTDVISTPNKTLTGWAVVVEEPVSSIYESSFAYIRLSIVVGLVAIGLSILFGLYFSRQLIRPIRALVQGAQKIEQGDFSQVISVKTRDELQELAETFNGMSRSIKKLIGDLKTNNLRLKFEQIKLNNIISSVSDGVLAVNAQGKIISINPPAAILIDSDPQTLQGKSMTECFPWEHDGEPFVPDLKLAGIYHYTDLVMKRGETTVYVDLMVAVLDHQDSDVAAIITMHDQTASRELSFMKLDFVAIAAHELRTPLTVVRGYLDMLSTGTATKELSIFNLENLSKAIDGADQLRALINKLLNIARIERGDMEIFIEKLNISKLVHENVDQHISIATQKEQTISFHANTDSAVYVPADPASMVEVVNNLVGNALKYTPKGGKIKVNLIAGPKEVRVEVIDNGPGVPNELRDRLFTKFYRAERSLIAGSRGTGLGLFISKTIIELQNGTIGIEPDKGGGSTFFFTLPTYDPARDDELIAKKSAGGIRGWFKKRPNS